MYLNSYFDELEKLGMSTSRRLLREAYGTPEYDPLVKKLEEAGVIDREAIA